MNFKELYTELLDYSNASPIAAVTQAKRAINNAMRWANRQHDFKFAEGVVNITYPANQFMLDLEINCDQHVNNLICIQQVPTSTATAGLPLPIIEYPRLQGKRFKHQLVKQTNIDYEETDGQLRETIEEYHVFLMGRGFGLYPTPTTDVHLFIHFNERLAAFSADGDTNFLSEYCHDFLITKALFSNYMVYLPKDRLEVLSVEAVQAEWASVVAWDSQIRKSENYFESL